MTFELTAQTRKLLDLFVNAEYGTTFSYDEILAKTGCDLRGSDRQRIYVVLRRLERDHSKTLLNLRAVGYRVAHPNEHVGSMMVRKGRAGAQITRARQTGLSTNLARLNSGEVRDLDDALVWMSQAEQIIMHHDRRIARLEERLNRVDPAGREEPAVEGSAVEDA